MNASALSLVLLMFAAGATIHAQQLQAPPPVAPPPGWTPTPTAISLQPGNYKQETITIQLAPKEGMEYKYVLARGAAMLYSWTANAVVHYEMHSEPEGAPRGFAEFFDQKSDQRQGNGSYVAPYHGIHGWFFENRSDAPVSITFTSAGFYTESREFRRAQPVVVKRF